MEEVEVKDETLDIAKAISDEFKVASRLPRWMKYDAVSKFKSVRRAIRRGHVDLFFGIVYPRKPFNNRKPTPGRAFNGLKRKVYGQYKLQ